MFVPASVRSRILSMACAACAFVACGDDAPAIDYTAARTLDIVTGVDATDVNGASLGRRGNPNDFGELLAYPNPAVRMQTIEIADTEIDVAWLIPANVRQNEKSTDFAAAFDGFSGYDTLTLNTQARGRVGRIGNISAPAIDFDLRRVEAGFYRMVAQDIEGRQHATAVYIDPDSPYDRSVETVINTWD